MSLFRAEEWWSTNLLEEFDSNAIVVGQVFNTVLNNNSNPNPNPNHNPNYIVLGSVSGILRIYLPSSRGYNIEDLIIEENLNSSILQLKLGRFDSTDSSNTCLAVLHPLKVSVYKVEGDGKNFYRLDKLYECCLGKHFTAFNMVCGNFGSNEENATTTDVVSDTVPDSNLRDLVCVQSMDGRLKIFEYEVHAFTRRLNNVLVPGPLCYVPKLDSFITVNSQMNVECYKYHVLASSQSDGTEDQVRAAEDKGNEKTKRKSATVSAVKRVTVDWTICVGEDIVEIKIGRVSTDLRSNGVDIVVLGAHTLFVLNEQGIVKTQMRIDFDPACISLYATPPTYQNHNMIISEFDTDSLHIYKQTKKIWSAKMASAPIFAQVSSFGEHKAMIACLSDTGTLSVNYMGTSPPSSSVVSEAKDINYDEIDEEHRKLLAVIRASQSDTRLEPKDKIMLRYQVPKALDHPGQLHELDGHEHILEKCVKQDGGLMQLTVKLFVSYSGTSELRNVSININAPSCALTKHKSIKLASLKGGSSTPLILDLTFYANAQFLPCETQVIVTMIYLTTTGEPRTAKCLLDLPMFFVARLVPPVKEPTFKFTLETNKPPVLLATLFEDVFFAMGETESTQAAGNNANYVLSFRYWMADNSNNNNNNNNNNDDSGMHATIMLSKNAGRYRIQSHHFGALWFVASELTIRLNKYFDAIASAGGEGNLELTYKEPLPLADFYATIDTHFQHRQDLVERKSLLNDCAQQFRTIEKRLLVRFKDKNAVPLQNLDVIMSETYHRLLELAQHVEHSQFMLAVSQNVLACSTSLFLLLIKFRFNLDTENANILKAHLTPNVRDNDDNGWEETTDAAITHLLRTVLAKNKTENGEQTATSNRSTELVMPENVSKLKKHISIVCDRLLKGENLTA